MPRTSTPRFGRTSAAIASMRPAGLVNRRTSPMRCCSSPPHPSPPARPCASTAAKLSQGMLSVPIRSPGATMINKSLGLRILCALTFALAAPALAGDSVKINDLVIAGEIPAVQREATVKAVRAFYDFWNTDNAALLDQAIGEKFTERTLPSGRPPGPKGPAFAPRQVRTAVPHLH